MRSVQARAGFSLTELLVVIAIIVVLLSVLLVGVQAVYTHAMQLKCQHNLEVIGSAIKMYSSKCHGLMPLVWDPRSQRRWYETLAATCIDNPAVIACPLEPTPTLQSTIGAPSSMSDPILKTLCWLKKVQGQSTSNDSSSYKQGAWDVNSWGGCGGGRGDGYRTGVSSLALLAFLGYGCTDRYPPEFCGTVSNAISYILSKQVHGGADDGKFSGYNNGKWYLYDHATATLAMATAYATTGRADCRAAAAAGLKHLILQQSTSGGGWGYVGGATDSDMSLTGWAIQAFHACDVLGIKATDGSTDLSAQGRAGIQTCLANMVYGYTAGSTDYSGRYRYYPEGINDQYRQEITSISLAVRLLMGHRPASSASMSSDSGRCKGVLDYERGRSDYFTTARAGSGMLYYYYYMTMANSILGDDGWKQWTSSQGGNPPVFPDAFLSLQDKGDPNSATYGSWPPGICIWGSYAGRAYTSAVSVLALECGLPGHWQLQPATGQCSYGYNTHLGEDFRTVAADTVMVMDYNSWVINRGNYDSVGNMDPNRNDTPDCIALRHGGKANVLLGDGRVRNLALNEFTDGMWSIKPGD